MFSIVSTLAAIPVSLARASSAGVSLAHCLRAIQSRHPFPFILPIQNTISLSGRVRSLSSQTHKTGANPSLAQGIIPKMTQKLADRRVQSAKNRSSQRGLCCLDTPPFGMIDFWQLSIPPIGQLLSHLGYNLIGTHLGHQKLHASSLYNCC